VGASAITPVTVLTGFLGSGKTTLVNRLVRDARFADTAVLVNEWGVIPIDHALVREASDNVVVLAGGCICCRVAGEVVSTLRELHFLRAEGRVPDFRRVVIETTGLADPSPLLATLVELPLVAARYSLAGVVATVDAEYGERTLPAHGESVKQVALADRIVITKWDLVTPEDLVSLEVRLAAINPGATILRSANADLDVARLLDTGLYRADGVAADSRGWLSDETRAWVDVERALETLLQVRGDRILRLKGLVNVAGEPGPRAVHAVQHRLYPSARLPAWPDADRSTRLVFIGRGLEEGEIAGILESSPRSASVQR